MSNAKTGLLEQVVCAICKFILWVTTSMIFFILITNTVLRYSRGSSLQWANELPELMFPWLVMSGIVLASVHGSHIATTFMMDAAKPKVRRIIGIAVWLVVAGMYATLSWATFGMLEIVADERTPILQVPGSVTYICMLGGMGMLGLLALQSAWKVLRHEIGFPREMDSDAAINTAQG